MKTAFQQIRDGEWRKPESISITTTESATATAALLDAVAIRLTRQARYMILASDIRVALLDALAEQLPHGGVVLLWYDEAEGLRVNLCEWRER